MARDRTDFAGQLGERNPPYRWKKLHELARARLREVCLGSRRPGRSQLHSRAGRLELDLERSGLRLRHLRDDCSWRGVHQLASLLEVEARQMVDSLVDRDR